MGRPDRRRHIRRAILGAAAAGAMVVALAGCAEFGIALPGATPAPVEEPFVPQAGPWDATAMDHRGADGQAFEYDCPADGSLGVVWGTNVYTDDSSVCTAAVHMGLITVEEGGTVRIVIRPGLGAYLGSERNGVTTQRWGEWDGSFVFVGV
jgi:hypothetical protein